MATQFTQEQLQHYIDHPEEVDATDTDLVNALASAELATLGVSEDDKKELGLDKPEGTESDGEDAEAARIAKEAIAEAEAEAAKQKAEEEAAKKAAATEGDAGAKEAGAGDKPARISTKDGNHTMPYSVLEEARGRAAGAEAALAEAHQTVLDLQSRLRALEAGKADPGNAGATVAELEAKLAELDALGTTAEEEAPWLKGMRTLVDTVKTLQQKVDGYEQERTESEEDAKARLVNAAKVALEGNAALVLWQTTAPALFNEAIAVDRMLRADPVQQKRFPTFEARYAQVVKLVTANHEGEQIPLPEATSPTAKNTKQSAADIDAAARKALAKAEDATAVRTLTDIPGGEGEVTTEEHLSRQSPLDLAERFSRMTPQQIVDFTMTH